VSGSSQASQLVAGPLSSTTVLRACLVHLGWRVDLAGERSIVATLSRNEIARQDFSASVTWQPQDRNWLVSVRVIETGGKKSERACESQVQEIVGAIRQICREARVIDVQVES
jgi:hypothetical protein